MNPTILVVEDDREINELVGEYLALENIKPLQAATGQEGIDLAVANHPDAVVLDLMLPDIHGFEVAKRLSAARATYDIPIIILSCMCQHCDKEEGYRAGALFYMNKPFLPDDLLLKLRQAIDWKQALRSRTPAATILLGTKDSCLTARGINELTADLFTRTDLSDKQVSEIRAAAQLLTDWQRQWNKDHTADASLRLEYQINETADAGAIDWKLSDSGSSILSEAFPKAPAPAGLLMGWSPTNFLTKSAPSAPATLPTLWTQLLSKLGDASLHSDPRTRTITFTRPLTPKLASV